MDNRGADVGLWDEASAVKSMVRFREEYRCSAWGRLGGEPASGAGCGWRYPRMRALWAELGGKAFVEARVPHVITVKV